MQEQAVDIYLHFTTLAIPVEYDRWPYRLSMTGDYTSWVWHLTIPIEYDRWLHQLSMTDDDTNRRNYPIRRRFLKEIEMPRAPRKNHLNTPVIFSALAAFPYLSGSCSVIPQYRTYSVYIVNWTNIFIINTCVLDKGAVLNDGFHYLTCLPPEVFR